MISFSVSFSVSSKVSKTRQVNVFLVKTGDVNNLIHKYIDIKHFARLKFMKSYDSWVYIYSEIQFRFHSKPLCFDENDQRIKCLYVFHVVVLTQSTKWKKKGTWSYWHLWYFNERIRFGVKWKYKRGEKNSQKWTIIQLNVFNTIFLFIISFVKKWLTLLYFLIISAPGLQHFWSTYVVLCKFLCM